MAENNTTMYFGITGGIAALVIGYLAIGFHFKYIPPVLAVLITIILFTRKIDSLKLKNISFIKYIFLGFSIALSTLFLAALAGSTVLFIMSYLDYLYPEILNFRMNVFDSDSVSFNRYFFTEGISYLLTPLVSVMASGFIPALIFGLFYGIIKHRQQC